MIGTCLPNSGLGSRLATRGVDLRVWGPLSEWGALSLTLQKLGAVEGNGARKAAEWLGRRLAPVNMLFTDGAG